MIITTPASRPAYRPPSRPGGPASRSRPGGSPSGPGPRPGPGPGNPGGPASRPRPVGSPSGPGPRPGPGPGPTITYPQSIMYIYGQVPPGLRPQVQAGQARPSPPSGPPSAARPGPALWVPRCPRGQAWQARPGRPGCPAAPGAQGRGRAFLGLDALAPRVPVPLAPGTLPPAVAPLGRARRPGRPSLKKTVENCTARRQG